MRLIKYKGFKIIVPLAVLAILLPFIFVVSMYIIARNTGFEGARGGPQDAFRHTYSSALVARYISPKAVKLVTWVSERKPDSDHCIMDIHNNNLGIQIGLSSANQSLYSLVYDKVLSATIKQQVDPKTMDNNQLKAVHLDEVIVLNPSRWENSDI